MNHMTYNKAKLWPSQADMSTDWENSLRAALPRRTWGFWWMNRWT